MTWFHWLHLVFSAALVSTLGLLVYLAWVMERD
jgi:hypothetical protein